MPSPKQTTNLPLIDNGLARAVDQGTPAKRPRRFRFLLVPLILVPFFSGAVIGMYFQPPALRAFFNITGLTPGAGTDTPIAVAIKQVQSQEVVSATSEGDVVALGRITPLGDVVQVAPPSGTGDARLARLDVSVGQKVLAGDILAVLDNLEQLQSGVAAAQADITVHEASLVQIREAIRASRDEARAALERAEATATAAKLELDRATSLFDRGVTTRAAFDQIVAHAAEAGRDVERNIATLSRFEPGSQTAQADIAVAEARLAAARVQLAGARLDLERAYVRAPSNGTVLSINTQPGERPGTDGVLDLGDTSQMLVKAEVYQTLIGKILLGDTAAISADALQNDLTGTVTAIGLEIGRQSITSDDPAANTDARVVEVTISLDPQSSVLAQRYSNLEGIVRIDGNGSR